jgi:hypothetical protein
MIAGAALATWLADADRQKRSFAAIEDCARRWSRQPLMTEIERQLAALPERSPAAVLDVARAFMDRDDEVAALMAELLASCAGDPFFRPPFHPMVSEVNTGLLLFHNADLSIALGVGGVDLAAAKKVEARGASSITFTGVTTMFRYVKAGGATISLWEAPPITDGFLASQAGKCRLTGRRRLEDGDEIVIDGRYQSFIVEHVVSDMLYFQAIARTGAAPLAAEYDSKSLAFVGASSTDESSSRIQMMVSLLRTMEREDALPLIEESLASPHFYTRWHIMREFLAMDADAALPALRRMAANDSHPEVRAAAQQTLEMFFEDEPAEQGTYRCRA